MKHKPVPKQRRAPIKETGSYLGFPLYQAAVQNQVKRPSFFHYGYGLKQSATLSPHVHSSDKVNLLIDGLTIVNERNSECSFMEGTRHFHADKFHKQYMKDNSNAD